MLPPGLLDQLGPQTQQYLTNRVKMGGMADLATAVGQGLDKYYGVQGGRGGGPQGAGMGGGYTQQAINQVPGLLEYQQGQQERAQEQQRMQGLLGTVDQFEQAGIFDAPTANFFRAQPEAMEQFMEERHKSYSLSPGQVRGQGGSRLDTGLPETFNVAPGAAAYSRDADGNLKPLASRATAAMQNERAGVRSESDNVRAQKIRSLQIQGVPLARAERLVDKFERIEVVPQLGVARYINEVTGTVDEVPLGMLSDAERAFATTPSQPAPEQPVAQSRAPSMGLYEAAELGTGPYSALRDLGSRAAGFDPTESVPIAEETIEARSVIELSNRNLLRSLSNNPRFPVAEMNRIREQTQIEPSAFDSPRRLRSRLREVENYIQGEMESARRVANNPNTPMAQRQAYRQAADDMENYLSRFGPRPGESAPQQPMLQDDVPMEPPPEVPADLWEAMPPEDRRLFR
ncbi:hypothetical protein [Thioalkalivibrio sp.]|uniref:hypothetical protein n=1 Tax=Thioalkalivibrio sp. TaxID=2093813 RepID=UPI0035624110